MKFLAHHLAGALLLPIVFVAAAPVWATTWQFESPSGSTEVQPLSALVDGPTGSHVLYSDDSDMVYHALRTGSNQWQVDAVGVSAGGYALALDSAGNPHVALVKASGSTYTLVHYVKQGSAWSQSTSPADQAYGAEIAAPSMAIASDGTIHIAYQVGSQIKHTTCAQGNLGCVWTAQVVAGQPGGGQSTHIVNAPSLALKPDGSPGISYYDWTNLSLCYADWNGSTWINDTADGNLHNVGTLNSLAFDASGVPNIAYYDETSGWIKWISWLNGQPFSWTPGPYYGEIVDTGVLAPTSVKVFVDGSGQPHVAYRKSSGNVGSVMYASRQAGSTAWLDTWSSQTIDNTGNGGYGISIAADGAGNPELAYVWSPTGTYTPQIRFAIELLRIIVHPTPIHPIPIPR